MEFDVVGIEGYPVIIRFKTQITQVAYKEIIKSIEGYPVIIRFKTFSVYSKGTAKGSIEGYPVIIRFKT